MAITHLGNAGTWQDSNAALGQTTSASFTWNAGELLIAVLASDNYETTDGSLNQHVSISKGTTNFTKRIEWSNSNSAANAGVVVSVWTCLPTSSISNDTVVVYYGSTITKKALTIHRFSINGGLKIHSSTAVGGEDAIDPSSKSINDLTIGWDYLAIRAIGSESNDTTTLTTTSNFSAMTQAVTSGGSSASNIGVRAEYRIFNAASSTITSDPTLFSADHSSVLICIHESAIYRIHGLAQVRIKGIEKRYAQAQSKIKTTYNVTGLARTRIDKFIVSQAQSLIGIKTNLYSFINEPTPNDTNRLISSTDTLDEYVFKPETFIPQIKANYYVYYRAYAIGPDAGSGNIMTMIIFREDTSNLWAYGAGITDIPQTHMFSIPNNVIASISDFSKLNIVVRKQSDETNHRIVLTWAALSIPKGYSALRYGQSNAFIYNGILRYGLAQVSIKLVPQKLAQSQSKIKTTYHSLAQSQSKTKQTSKLVGQAQVYIRGTLQVYGQAQATTKKYLQGYGQTQAKLKIVSYSYGQSQTKIKQSYLSYAQSQGSIKTIYKVLGQASAQVGNLTRAYGQAQVKTRGTDRAYAQSQAAIKQIYKNLAQSQSQINHSYQGYAITQVVIYYANHIVPIADITNNGWIGIIL